MWDPTFGVLFDGKARSPTLWERILGRWWGTGSCNHWWVLQQAGGWPDAPPPRFLLRVDDFPRWDRSPKDFRKVHKILRDASIRYVLGVIPCPCQNPLEENGGPAREWTSEEAAILSDVAAEVEIAMHGFSHRRRPGPVRNEIVGCAPEELERKVGEGLDVLHSAGLSARSFIPPFNAVDDAALTTLASRFDVVFGGPESVRWLGCIPGPCRLGKIWYLPSYPPAYGRAEESAGFVRAVRDRRLPILIPVTLHWAWEEADDFRGVQALAAALAGATVALDDWVEGRAW